METHQGYACIKIDGRLIGKTSDIMCQFKSAITTERSEDCFIIKSVITKINNFFGFKIFHKIFF